MKYLTEIRAKKPLVQHLTNTVTMLDCAQVTRAIGALPVMTAPQEAADMVAIASALVINIGTLDDAFVAAAIAAGQAANAKGIPVVLDAVGAGATQLRTDAVLHIAAHVRIAVLKGNASEIAIIAGTSAEVRGVESIGVVQGINDHAQAVASQHNCVVVVSGAVDIIANETDVQEIHTGHQIMSRVVGTGCTLGSALGAFLAVTEESHFEAAAACITHYGDCGARAAMDATGPMDWKNKFYDTLAQ